MLLPTSEGCWDGASVKRSTAMSNKSIAMIATMGIDIGKNSFNVVGLNQRGAIVMRQKWSHGRIEAQIANTPPCLIGMEAWLWKSFSSAAPAKEQVSTTLAKIASPSKSGSLAIAKN